MRLLCVLVLVACGGAPRVHGAIHCGDPQEQLELRVGESAVSATGVRVSYTGTSHDDYDDGRFEDWGQLVLERDGQRQTATVSLYATEPVEVLHTCVWVAGQGERIRVSLARL